MQFIRERLSLNLVSAYSSEQPSSGTKEDGQQEGTLSQNDIPPVPPARRHRSEVAASSPMSTVSGPSVDRDTYRHARLQSMSSAAPSIYATPYQSPVVSEKSRPHSHPNMLVVNPSLDNTNSSTSSPMGTSKVFVIDHGQISSSGYPQPFTTQLSGGGYINHSFTSDGGQSVTRPGHSTQESLVIREQYWAWSCKCRRQLSNREKILLLVIGFLLLIIGGLSAYLAIVTGDGSPLHGGLLTQSVLSQKTVE